MASRPDKTTKRQKAAKGVKKRQKAAKERRAATRKRHRADQTSDLSIFKSLFDLDVRKVRAKILATTTFRDEFEDGK